MRLRFWKREKKTRLLSEEEHMVEDSYVASKQFVRQAQGISAIFDDDPKITKGQCMGFLKSGKQCSRNVDTVYCYQHKRS